mmetsp:Transcript_81693/g.142087  ORF Transcript_81693/g.142087 Transcript_81693/m.142087 type:complete len:299 (+) Transcript_81693:48-944(+)
MTAYRPGQGLNSEALERLRLRKQHATEGLNLPAQDESKQWDHLLGEGAKKKPRCGICTMPLSEAEHAAKQLVCQGCSTPTVTPADSRKTRRRTRLSCATPSTRAGSEDWSESGRSTPCGPVPSVPTPSKVTLSLVRQTLEGAWMGSEGESYRFICGKEVPWSCVLEEDPRFPLTCPLVFDEPGNKLLLGATGSHMLDLDEFLSDFCCLRWHPSSDPSETSFVWRRPEHKLPEEDFVETSSTTSEASLSSNEMHPLQSKRAKTLVAQRTRTRRHTKADWQPTLQRILSHSLNTGPSDSK